MDFKLGFYIRNKDNNKLFQIHRIEKGEESNSKKILCSVWYKDVDTGRFKRINKKFKNYEIKPVDADKWEIYKPIEEV